MGDGILMQLGDKMRKTEGRRGKGMDRTERRGQAGRSWAGRSWAEGSQAGRSWAEGSQAGRRKGRRRKAGRRLCLGSCVFLLGFVAGGLFVLGVLQRALGNVGGGGTAVAYAQGAGISAGMGETMESGAQAATESEGRLEEGWNLELVNAAHGMDPDYVPVLAEVERGYQVDIRMEEPLREMLQDARAQGFAVRICSAYRTWEKQESLYEAKVEAYREEGMGEKEARETAARTVAAPGTSEHQLGLAVDLVSEAYQILDEKQEETPEQQWLMAHCQEYGFILRYPSDKTEETGIIYEPWHYRYVGQEAAREMMERGICLEEYLEERAQEE